MNHHLQNLIFPMLFILIVIPSIAALVITVAAYFIVVQVVTRKK